MIDISRKPRQAIPLKKKLNKGEEGKQWRKDNVDYFAPVDIGIGDTDSYISNLYKLAQGHLVPEQYTYITNPQNTNQHTESKGARSRNYPARLRNYDIITPKINLVMGEFIKRYISPQVIAVNSDIKEVREQVEYELKSQQLDQVAINALNETVDTGYESKEVQSQESIKAQAQSIKDIKSITGANALRYIEIHQELRQKLRKAFYNFLVTYQTYSYRDVEDEDVIYKVISPHYGHNTMSSEVDFGEDGESASVTFEMTLSEIIDKFGDELTKEELQQLEEVHQGIHPRSKRDNFSSEEALMSSLEESGAFGNNRWINKNNKYLVDYVNWKSIHDSYMISGTDIFGEEYSFEVDEDFIFREDETVKKRKVNQTWEGWRIRLLDGIYLGIRPVPFQRGTFNNPGKCKLLINFRTGIDSNARPKSLVEKLIPYQHRYNAVHWQLEKMMNRFKGSILLVPYSLTLDEEDMDMFDQMYYADADGNFFVDDSTPQKKSSLSNVRFLDDNVGKYIMELYQILDAINKEAEDVIGVSPQRRGDIKTSAGKSVTDSAIVRSSLITEEIFTEFEEFMQRDFQCLLDLSKFAWKNGKKARFVDPSINRDIFLNVVGEQYQELEYAVYATNHGEYRERLEKIRAQSQALAQNAAAQKPSLLVSLESTDNIEELQRIMEHHERDFMERSQMQAEQEQAQQQAKVEAEQANKDADRMLEIEKMNKEHTVALLEAEIKLLQAQKQEGIDTGVIDDKLANLQIQREKLQVEREKLQVKREEMQVKLQNKVAGEK